VAKVLRDQIIKLTYTPKDKLGNKKGQKENHDTKKCPVSG